MRARNDRVKVRFWRRSVLTVVGVCGFVLLYEATVEDSRYAAQQAAMRETTAVPAPGARLRFSATAYCKGSTTASGVAVRSGVAAADPDLLPVGTVVQVETGFSRYDGIYTIMDTGPKVQGRHIDIYMWSCHEALDYGRRSIRLTVLRLGWSPRASSPTLIDQMFKKREEQMQPLPSRTLPLTTELPK